MNSFIKLHRYRYWNHGFSSPHCSFSEGLKTPCLFTCTCFPVALFKDRHVQYRPVGPVRSSAKVTHMKESISVDVIGGENKLSEGHEPDRTRVRWCVCEWWRVVLYYRACVWLNCVRVCVCYCVSVQCSCSRGVVCGSSNCCFRRAGSSVVELSIAARRVTGSNPVSRLLLLPCAPRNGPLSIACCLFLCSPSIPESCEYTPRSRTNIPQHETTPTQTQHDYYTHTLNPPTRASTPRSSCLVLTLLEFWTPAQTHRRTRGIVIWSL